MDNFDYKKYLNEGQLFNEEPKGDKVYYVSVSDGNDEQIIYIKGDLGNKAKLKELAIEKSSIEPKKVKIEYLSPFNELDPEEQEQFEEGIAIFEPESLNEQYSDPQDIEQTPFDKQYKNPDNDITIVDVEKTKKDTSGPWATTANSEDLIFIQSKNDNDLDENTIREWVKKIKGFNSSYMIDRKILGINEPMPGEWTIELRTTVWQN